MLVRGAYRTVRFAVRPGGKLAGRQEWDALPDIPRARLEASFGYLAENGRPPNPSQVKTLSTYGLQQWRHGDYRVLCCNRGRELVICAVVSKTTKKLRSPEFERARRICTEDIGGAP